MSSEYTTYGCPCCGLEHPRGSQCPKLKDVIRAWALDMLSGSGGVQRVRELAREEIRNTQTVYDDEIRDAALEDAAREAEVWRSPSESPQQGLALALRIRALKSQPAAAPSTSLFEEYKGVKEKIERRGAEASAANIDAILSQTPQPAAAQASAEKPEEGKQYKEVFVNWGKEIHCLDEKSELYRYANEIASLRRERDAAVSGNHEFLGQATLHAAERDEARKEAATLKHRLEEAEQKLIAVSNALTYRVPAGETVRRVEDAMRLGGSKEKA